MKSVAFEQRLVQASRLGLRIFRAELPGDVELEPAPPRLPITAPARDRFAEAHRAGLDHGAAHLPAVEWSATMEVQHKYIMGYQAGQQRHYANRGERDALLGWPRQLPFELADEFEPEYLTGWDRGRALFLGQVEDARLGAGRITDRDAWPLGCPS